MRVLVVDVLAREHGERKVTVDVIGVGPRAVAGLLEKIGVHADVKPLEALEEKELEDYDVLFVSAMTSDLPAARTLLKTWRRRNSGLAVLGGPAAVEPLRVLDEGFDVVVVGEAEVILPSLVDCISSGDVECLYDVKGIAFRARHRRVFTGRARYATREELNFLHSTRVEGYPLYWASRVYVEIVRGCSNWRRPHMRLADGRTCIGCNLCDSQSLAARLTCPAWIPAGCGYCSVPQLYGPARSRSIDVIVEEVKKLVDKGVTRVVLSAPDVLDYGRDLLVEPMPLTNPCRPPPNLNALGELLERLYQRVPEFETKDAFLMIENVKACLVTPEAAKLLSKYLRGTPVHIGVETGSERHMRSIGRPVTKDDVRRAVRLLRDAGLEPYVYFIYGLPGESEETVRETVEFMRELWSLGARKITAYKFRPLPGTAFQEYEPPRPGSVSYRILDEATRLNRLEKRLWVGKRVEAIVAGLHGAKRMLVAYPLPHGPVTLVKGSKSLIGWRVRIEVTGVESDRMLRGRVVSRVKRVAWKRMLFKG